MNKRLESYLFLAELFKKNGFQLYLVGGSVRDYLLNVPLTDMDAVTDATPNEMKAFLPDANYVFAKYGNATYKVNDVKFDITTMRKEKEYSDSRHPNNIIFVKDLSIDVLRRDFTINAMYLDSNLKLIDYVDGEKDLSNHLLRMIGDPNKRLKEDPLRIIRALRFALDYDLEIDHLLDKAIKDNIEELKQLNVEKIKQDLKKMKCSDGGRIEKLFAVYNIKPLLDVIK